MNDNIKKRNIQTTSSEICDDQNRNEGVGELVQVVLTRREVQE